jgi:hypothetical protein
MFGLDWKEAWKLVSSFLKPAAIWRLFAYPWTDKVTILELEAECEKSQRWLSVAAAVGLGMLAAFLSGVLTAPAGSFYFALVRQIVERDGIGYVAAPLAFLLLSILIAVGLIFWVANHFEKILGYGPAGKWAWFSFATAAGVTIALMHLAMYVFVRLLGYVAPYISYTSFASAALVFAVTFCLIAGSLLILVIYGYRKIKSLVQVALFGEYRLRIVLLLALVWAYVLIGSIGFVQSLHEVRGDPAKIGEFWKLPTVGMTMIGCDLSEKTVSCVFSAVTDELPDLILAGKWHSADGANSARQYVAWEPVSGSKPAEGTIAVSANAIFDITLRANKEDVCPQLGRNSQGFMFEARARGTTPPISERQKLLFQVINTKTFASELADICR